MKNLKKWPFSILFGPILDVFEDFLILNEKQQLKPKNSRSLRFFTSFGTQLDPRIARLVERNKSEVKKPRVEYRLSIKNQIHAANVYISTTTDGWQVFQDYNWRFMKSYNNALSAEFNSWKHKKFDVNKTIENLAPWRHSTMHRLPD